MDIHTFDATPVALLPATQSVTEISKDKDSWLQEGFDLAHDAAAMNWRWCDWFLRGEARGYGTLKTLCGMPNWPGPHYRRFQNMLSVARKVGSRRREGVSFELHAMVAPFPENQQQELLDWIEHENGMGKPITKTVFKQKITEFRLEKKQEVTINSGKRLKHLIKKLAWSQKEIDEMQLLIETHRRDFDPEAREQAYKVLRQVRDLASSFAEDFRDRRPVTQES